MAGRRAASADSARAPRRPARGRVREMPSRRLVSTRSAGLRRRRRPSDGRRRLQLAALVEDLDAALGFLEPRMAEPRQLDAALVERERLLERQVAFLELLDDRLELGDRGFEVLNGGVGPCRRYALRLRCVLSCSRTSQSSSPFASVTRTDRPAATVGRVADHARAVCRSSRRRSRGRAPQAG